MSVSDLLVKSYQLTNKTGLLSLPLAKRAFRSSYFLYKRYLEDPFASLVKEHPEFFAGGNILDIGANIGYTASVFADAVDAGFSVYSFEPDSDNYAQLVELSQSSKFSSVITPVHAAVGAEEGSLQLWYNEAHHADHRVATTEFKGRISDSDQFQSVKQWSIDTFVANQSPGEAVRFVKIDVQGYELPVLQGMSDTLKRNKEIVIAIEIAPQHIEELGFKVSDILDFLETAGFVFHHLELRRPLKEVSWAEIDEIAAARGYLDLLCCPRSVS